MLGPLLDPLVDFGFMRAGLAAASIVGVVSAVLSCLLVVRRQALLGDAISHAVFLGVVLGFLAAGHLGVLWGALVVAVVAGLAITYIERSSRVKIDAAMGIVFTAAFALGLAIVSIVQPRGIDLFHILFGNVLGVSTADLVVTATAGGVTLLGVLVWFRAFHVWTFDPQAARLLGVPVARLEYGFTALLSAAVVSSLQTVGLLLVVAMLVTPGATGALLATRLTSMMLIATGCGLLASIGGLYVSYYVDVASGPAIVLLASLLFCVGLVIAKVRGT